MPQIFPVAFTLCSRWYVSIHTNNGIFFCQILDFDIFLNLISLRFWPSVSQSTDCRLLLHGLLHYNN